MNGMAFSPLVKSIPFKSWIYQIIKTQPYCYPMRNKSDLALSGSIKHRTNILCTVVLGTLWNSKVRFGDDVKPKKDGEPEHLIPRFSKEYISEVKDVIN